MLSISTRKEPRKPTRLEPKFAEVTMSGKSTRNESPKREQERADWRLLSGMTERSVSPFALLPLFAESGLLPPSGSSLHAE